MKSISLFLKITAVFLSMAFAAMIEQRQISLVPSGSVTTITSIYTSVNTQVISPTVAVWTDPSTTQTTWLPIQTPKPTVITSVTTQYVYNAYVSRL